MPTTVAPPSSIKPVSVGFNLVAIVVATAMLGLGLAYLIDRIGRTGHEASAVEGTITRGIGGVELKIPAAFFRNGEQRSEGFADEIELVAHLPLGIDARDAAVEVTLLPRSRARSSASLLDGVYLHQFEDVQLAGPPGLVGKPLLPTAGFSGETVWYDALKANPFVAKCLAPILTTEPTQCLRTVLYGNIAIVYTFGEDVLMNWRQFDAAAEPWLAEMGIR